MKLITEKLISYPDKLFCRAKIAEFQDAEIWIEEQILWFDISMANAVRMNVTEGAEQLIHIQLDVEHWNSLLNKTIIKNQASETYFSFGVISSDFVHVLGYQLENQI